MHCVIRDWNSAETASKEPGEVRDAGRERDWRREEAAACPSRGERGLRPGGERDLHRGRMALLGPPRCRLVRSAMHRLTKTVFKFDY